MARSSVECILIMVNSCNAQPCRRECELFASGSEMYPVQKYHFHRANSFPTRDRNHATREQFLEITILQITTLSTCISPIWKCIPTIIQRVSPFTLRREISSTRDNEKSLDFRHERNYCRVFPCSFYKFEEYKLVARAETHRWNKFETHLIIHSGAVTR